MGSSESGWLNMSSLVEVEGTGEWVGGLDVNTDPLISKEA